MIKLDSKSGFILPVVVSSILVVAVIAGGALSYISYATRVGGVYMTESTCRFSAQTALDQTKIQIRDAFALYSKAYPTSWNALSWFDTYSAQSIGASGYSCSMMQGKKVGDCTVTVALGTVGRSGNQYADVTMLASASAQSPSGIVVTRKIEETVRFPMVRSQVFDYAYFVNNYGWFRGSGCTANGDIRSNGDMELDSYSYINGSAFAAPNGELDADGVITVVGGGRTRFMPTSTYWSSSGTWARPTNPTSSDSSLVWAMGYESKSSLYNYQDTLEMPYLGDLSVYREQAVAAGGTIKQNGKVLVDGCFSGTGPSGIANGADAGSIVLDGTSKPLIINGPVVVNGDVIIKGTVSGQGVIYAGRNIHIVGNVTYKTAPSWTKPDSSPDKTIKNNASADMLGLVAKGNIVLGNYSDSSWLSACRNYITSPFVTSYTCDPTDSSIGYGTTFNGNYTAADSGSKITYTYDWNKNKYVISQTADRKYYESSVGSYVINANAQSTAISEVDAILYNNHAVMGQVGSCIFNGSLVCRNEGIIYSSSVAFNWDSRLGSRSPDGIDFFIHLPPSMTNPRVISWLEVVH